jgi:RNA polymerase sigma factor (TIGR02999 family)
LAPDLVAVNTGSGPVYWGAAFGRAVHMSKPALSHVTTLLGELRRGNEQARDELVTLVYPELRRIAAHYLRQERPGHTLRTTGLVNEVYVRLFGADNANWQNRAHFFAAVAREMRHLLVDYARARNAKKRPDGNILISLADAHATADARDEDLLALDEALSRLEQIDARASRIVELRFFAGLSERETATALGISISTLKRDWNFAKAWLFDQLGSPAER